MAFTLEDIEALEIPLEHKDSPSTELSDSNIATEPEHIEVEVEITRELLYNEDSNYGIYGATPTQMDAPVILNKYNNISIKGVMQQLVVGATYNMVLKQVEDKNYGVGYEVQAIKIHKPTTLSQQKEYMKTILTEYQVKNIYDAYEGHDVIQMMQDGTFDHTKVFGMGETTYEKVRYKVLKSLELLEVLTELSQYGLNYNMVNKLVKHFGDNAQLLMQELNKNPYVLLLVDGIGFKKCDAYALKMGIEPNSPSRINACIEYVLNEAADNDGHSWIKLVSLYNKTNELLSIGTVKIKRFLEDYITNTPRKPIYTIEDNRIGLYKNYKYELGIHEKLKQLLASPPETVVSNIDERIKDAESFMGDGFKFTDEQAEGIKTICKNNVVLVRGKAGTGKTTILKGVIRALGSNLSYATCALSGKAAQRIAESTGLPSSTIHRLLGYKPNTGFVANADLPLGQHVVILDEASMLNTYLFYSLLVAIRNGAKFIIIGDTEQLEPIGCGNVFKDLCESGVIPCVTLTQVHRQAQKSGTLMTANEVRDGICSFTKKGAALKNKVIGELKDFRFNPYEDSDGVVKRIIYFSEQFKKTQIDTGLATIHDVQVIVPRKDKVAVSCENLNILLQEVFNPDFKPSIKKGKYEFKEGDKVIQCGNNYEDDIFNGTMGTILEVNVEAKEVTIDFYGAPMPVTYKKEDISQIDLAYALSVHRVQGSQFTHVVVGIDFSAYTMLTRQLIYTALTRAVKSCTVACVNDALVKAIGTNKSEKRNTYLADFLSGNVES